MITVTQAKELKPGTILYSACDVNGDGTPQRWKVNGKPRTWKTRPGEVEVPLKRGLREFTTARWYDLDSWCLTEQEADQQRTLEDVESFVNRGVREFMNMPSATNFKVVERAMFCYQQVHPMNGAHQSPGFTDAVLRTWKECKYDIGQFYINLQGL